MADTTKKKKPLVTPSLKLPPTPTTDLTQVAPSVPTQIFNFTQPTPEQLAGLQRVDPRLVPQNIGFESARTGFQRPPPPPPTPEMLIRQEFQGVQQQQEAAEQRGEVPTGQREEVEALEARQRGPDQEPILNEQGLPAGMKLTFDVSKLGDPPKIETITLTQEQLLDYQKGSTKDPVVQNALDLKVFMGDISTTAAGEIAALRGVAAGERITGREVITPQTITRIPGDDIWEATFRESQWPAIFGGLGTAGTAAGLLIISGKIATASAAAAATGIGMPAALIGIIGAGIIAGAAIVYSTWSANEKEATKNIKKVSRLTRTAATIIPTMMNRPNGIGKYQAMLNIARARIALNYEIDMALRGREEGTLTGDLADADGLIGELMEFRDVYLPMLEFEVNGAIADPNYHPELLQIPGITFDVEDLE